MLSIGCSALLLTVPVQTTMKPSLLTLALAIIAFLSPAFSSAKNAPANPKPFTAPELRQWKGGEGFLTLQKSPVVVYSDTVLAPIAETFAAQYKALTGTAPEIRLGKASKGAIALTLKPDKRLGAEGYRLDINKKVEISAPQKEGVIWGTQTLLQLLRQSEQLPVGTATDMPDYPVRGFMIDAGRKYIPLDYLYKLVDDMAYYKMNRLHVHLNDNGFKYYFDDDWDKTQAAFRMECESFPGLTARDGSYGKDEYRDFQKYAASRGVDIISEIDVPAHCLAFTRYMPETASADGRNDRDHLDLDSPATYRMLDTLLDEYLGGDNPVFTSPRFHIGTDEYQGDSLTMEKFRAFTDRYIKTVKKYGKKPLIWGSLSHAKGHTPVETEGVEMYLWSNDYAKPLDMIDLGYEVVSIPDGWIYIVPKAGYYYDYLNNRKLYDEWTPANINGVKIQERHPQLKGGMFAVWNDHPGNGITVRDIHHRVMHSLPVMATKTWNGADVSVPFDDFEKAAPSLGEAPGVNYLGRLGDAPATVLEMAEVAPGSTLPVEEIGYDYTVEFDIEGAAEDKGTVLFQTPEATLWLSDPITGNMGYSREDYLNSFRFNILPHERHHVRIQGTNRTVTLYVDGRLVDDMNERWVSYNGGKNKMAQVRTLVFPLRHAGLFRSKITNLKVSNHITDR